MICRTDPPLTPPTLSSLAYILTISTADRSLTPPSNTRRSLEMTVQHAHNLYPLSILNAFNAAAQLLPDILATITSFLPTVGFFPLSQVCHRWRAVVVSFPLLWRRIDCKSLADTLVHLERHRSVPLRLESYDSLSVQAMSKVPGHETKISSVYARLPFCQQQPFHHLFVTPSVEDLVLFAGEDPKPQEARESMALRTEFMSLRRLSVSGFRIPIDQITAPKLIHLSLKTMNPVSFKTVEPVLGMLRRCSQLETVLINILSCPPPAPHTYTPVALPKLRSLELGCGEVYASLVVFLRFPSTIAVGFRGLSIELFDLPCDWPHKSIHCVLGTIRTENITLAHIQNRVLENKKKGQTCLIRFEAPKGSLEILVVGGCSQDPFHPDCLLLPHTSQLDNVKTLDIMDCWASAGTLAATAPAYLTLFQSTLPAATNSQVHCSQRGVYPLSSPISNLSWVYQRRTGRTSTIAWPAQPTSDRSAPNLTTMQQ